MAKDSDLVFMKTPHHQNDPNAASRKKDHIELAFESQLQQQQIDHRFYYEPLLAGHPSDKTTVSHDFLGYVFRSPIWISSMTGGTEYAGIINKNLSKACQEFGLGMGLGSCRSLLDSDEHLEDFDVKRYMPERPLYANLGIAQVEQLFANKEIGKVHDLIQKLSADGLIIHVNPLQEWLQPEGDQIKEPPLDTLKQILDQTDIPIIVKEVGQGMGIESLRALIKLPIRAIDFAANGGTNFSKLELLRSDSIDQEQYAPVVRVGHSAEEMVDLANVLLESEPIIRCQDFIVSGGVRNFLDGYYLINKLQSNAIYGQASQFLKHARGEYDELRTFVQLQIKGLDLAYQMLKIKS